MNHLNFIPVVLQFKPDFSQFTIGLGVVANDLDGSASALFHLGFDKEEEQEVSFDLFYIQYILRRFS